MQSIQENKHTLYYYKHQMDCFVVTHVYAWKYDTTFDITYIVSAFKMDYLCWILLQCGC